MKTCIKCGSHAFNLYVEGIDQGGFCDVHYWQGRAHRAEAQPEQEPEVVSKAKFNRLQDDYNDLFNRALQDAKHAKAWRAHVNNCQLQGVDLDHVFKPPLTAQPEQKPVATMKMLHTYGDTTPPKRPWVGLTDANMKVLIEQARVLPKQSPCPDYNVRLLMLTNAALKELNT